jgi:hypothetical protein
MSHVAETVPRTLRHLPVDDEVAQDALVSLAQMVTNAPPQVGWQWRRQALLAGGSALLPPLPEPEGR